MRQASNESIVQSAADSATPCLRQHRELDELEMASDPLIDAGADLT